MLMSSANKTLTFTPRNVVYSGLLVASAVETYNEPSQLLSSFIFII